MLIIPVLDLRDGVIVRAYRGQRALYQPLQSTRYKSSQAVDVLAALLNRNPFPIVYIADLNAIQSMGRQDDAIIDLVERFPTIRFWLDAGFKNTATIGPWLNLYNVHVVIGSESHTLASELRNTLAAVPVERRLLSLDFLQGRFLGPSEILEDAASWPQRVIVMSLDHVGSGLGPDLDRLTRLRAHWPATAFFTAGGVRHDADLKQLQQLGIHGALVATALHDGRITREQIAALA
jgi:phosphoribosylformimino-5-aminoimidazole carboxamide ribotide isomerase